MFGAGTKSNDRGPLRRKVTDMAQRRKDLMKMGPGRRSAK